MGTSNQWSTWVHDEFTNGQDISYALRLLLSQHGHKYTSAAYLGSCRVEGHTPAASIAGPHGHPVLVGGLSSISDPPARWRTGRCSTGGRPGAAGTDRRSRRPRRPSWPGGSWCRSTRRRAAGCVGRPRSRPEVNGNNRIPHLTTSRPGTTGVDRDTYPDIKGRSTPVHQRSNNRSKVRSL